MKNESTTIIKAKNHPLELNLREIIKYWDLIILFVKRNYTTRYKQTILGSAWLFINPICTVVMNTFVFGAIAGLSTDGVPRPLFYLAGNILWMLFYCCLNDSSKTFQDNTDLFGKIYFPRMVIPISIAITRLGDFLIKCGLFIGLSFIYIIFGYHWAFNMYILLMPLLLLQTALLGMGFGIIIASFTTKYRDLQILVEFGMAIWMYLTPIVYSVSEISQQYMQLYMLNPVTPIVMLFKHALLGIGDIPWTYWGISWIVTVVVVFIGLVVFNRAEKTFMDVI